jgi:hypothetical protein
MGPGVGQIWADWQKIDEIHGKILEKNMEKKIRKITGFFERTLSFLLELFSGK